jgi:hypothetical protein
VHTDPHDLIQTERLLKYMASVGLIKETGKDSFAATNVTRALAEKGNQSGIHH